jgi:gliding motility-associated-like protein
LNSTTESVTFQLPAMNRTTRKLILLTLLSTMTCTLVQAQFFLNGNAVATNDSCFQLTAAVNGQAGSIWNGEMVSLAESFEVLVDIFVGCEDEQGADGLVFGLQPISTTIGTNGGALGFGDVEPALGVEFDTYQNLDFGDPVFDHITVIRDGILNHNQPAGALAGPVQANADDPNIEDCAYHPLRITWDADAQTLSVYLDCTLRLTYTADLVNDIFGGDPMVFWGFTSATGGLNNVHEVCFSYTSFLDELVDQTICPGESIQLEASGGTSYRWSPATGLSDTTSANPIATPEETTLYTVEITDDCGIPFYDDVLITVDNDQFTLNLTASPEPAATVAPGTELELDAGVDPAGEGYTYVWSTELGSTLSDSQAANPSLTASVQQTGVEILTVVVTSEAGCIQTASLNLNIDGPIYQIPNLFSPNGDRTNDRFGVFTQASLQDYQCKVFNRWGQVVFETTDPTLFWDGTYQGEPAPADQYIYAITFQVGDLPVEEKGGLTLLR